MRRWPGTAMAIQSTMLVLIGTLALLMTACRESGESGGTVATRDINAVMEAHVDTLMATAGVTGVAIGALDDGTPCILVLILEDSDAIKARIPASLEGHPVKILVSGRIEPMKGDSSG